MSIFSERLKNQRKEKGFTQITISEKLGIGRSTYAHYERGSREPDLEMLKKIATILETTSDYLIGKTNR
ncbi:helix-turn-helix domain-containing protein [Clostridium minihomine]|uniref:helix-turn-helix domain-containing protein n=1 Tax=Clostridium minihomine TaxID=2045012 RepID=UPI000C78763A|nr:helix-turn-helix transcriptional regulator [Clostridium minihomine]